MDIYLTEAFVLFFRGSLSSPRTPITSTINRLNSLTKHVTKDLTDQAVGSLDYNNSIWDILFRFIWVM